MTLNGYLQTIPNKIITLLAIKNNIILTLKTTLLALHDRNQHITFHKRCVVMLQLNSTASFVPFILLNKTQ